MRTIMALAMILTASAANAQDAHISVTELGLRTCAQFAQDYRETKDDPRHVVELAYFSWAHGFMSAMNNQMANEQTRNLTEWSPSAQTAHLAAFCDKNHSQPYVTAVFDLYRSLPIKRK